MKRRPRIYYSDSQKALMWERWKQGWTLHEIGKLFDRPHTSIHNILALTGGIRPADRRRAATALTLAEREEISRAIVSGESIRSIAARLERAPSTISREIKRNGDRDAYRANQAEEAAWERARRPKRCKLTENRALARIVAERLRMLWSPEQIAGWLEHTCPSDESHHVSHETIYRSLFNNVGDSLPWWTSRRAETEKELRSETSRPPLSAGLAANARCNSVSIPLR